MITGHGDDSYLFKHKVIADFSSNVHHKGLAQDLQQHLATQLHRLNNYPEANAQSLQEALADMHHLSAEEVLVTNGATEAFYLIAHAWRRQSATIIIPAFAEYEDACQTNDCSISHVKWERLEDNTLFHTDMVWLGNPNNPTGTVLSADTLQRLLQRNPKVLFVIDEAYVDFTTAVISMVPYNEYPNLLVVRSLTKTYAIPGLRLGYLLGQAHLTERILASKMPWSVNALAIEAGLYIAKNRLALRWPLQELLQATQSLMKALSIYVQVYPTHTNFILCRTLKGTAAELKQFLLKEHGVLIRDAGNFRSLTPQHFRVATQSTEKNTLLIKGIAAW